jgi:spermidine synthase
MNGGRLYTIVAVAGACVLVIEILGTRLLGPYYGTSLFLWSALISVTLAALSLGYAWGGRLADRAPRASALAWYLGLAGLWMLAVPGMRDPLLAMTERLGLRASVLLASFVLFFPPLTLLGMVSPYAIRLRASSLQLVGSTAGNLYAVSTVASVAGALLTGFWLVPLVGVSRLSYGTGMLLLLAAALAATASGSARARALSVLALLLPLAAGAWWLAHPRWGLSDNVRFLAQSPYAEIRVIDKEDKRYLVIDGAIHTITKPGTDELYQPYVHVAELVKELFHRPGRMLLVGLGGGAMVHPFAREGWRIDAVEIDPLVPQVAKAFFDLDGRETAIHVQDGRRWLSATHDRYDVIFFDAFGSSSIPFHLVTREAFAQARARLNPGGILALNVEAVGWQDELVKSLGATLRTLFPQVLALPIAEPPNKFGNLILLAADRPMAISDEALGNPIDYMVDDYMHWDVLLRNHAWDNRFVPGGGAVLTDDLNPSDLWAERINLVARRELHDFFGKSIASW